MMRFLKIAVLGLGVLLAGCSDKKEEAKIVLASGVSLDKVSMVLGAAETAVLTATVMPADATNKNIVWSSDNTQVVSVEGGRITGVAAGTAVVTAKTEDGGWKASCAVRTVVPIGNVSYLTGEWKLSMWNDSGDLAGKVYIRFNADKSFALYQNLNQAGYTRYTGTFQYDAAQNVLSGAYADGVAWKRGYKLDKVDADQVKWFDKDDVADVTNYVREAIPDYVKSPAVAAPAGTRAEERFL